MDALQSYAAFFIPVLIIQIVLILIALIDLVRRPADLVRGPKWLWIIVIILINFIGPIIYLVFGREET